MSNRIRSRSAMTFKELKNKTEEIYEFGNDWGLYVDIETNYQQNYKPQKINKTNFTLFKILELKHEDEEDEEDRNEEEANKIQNKKYNYFNGTLSFMTKIFFYLCLVLGFNYNFNKK
jgi:hypothetical protein